MPGSSSALHTVCVWVRDRRLASSLCSLSTLHTSGRAGPSQGCVPVGTDHPHPGLPWVIRTQKVQNSSKRGYWPGGPSLPGRIVWAGGSRYILPRLFPIQMPVQKSKERNRKRVSMLTTRHCFPGSACSLLGSPLFFLDNNNNFEDLSCSPYAQVLFFQMYIS